MLPIVPRIADTRKPLGVMRGQARILYVHAGFLTLMYDTDRPLFLPGEVCVKILEILLANPYFSS
jgi:hypothetical protein